MSLLEEKLEIVDRLKSGDKLLGDYLIVIYIFCTLGGLTVPELLQYE